MPNDSKIMTKTSVGRVVTVAIMRNNSTRKLAPVFMSGAMASVRMTLSSRDEEGMSGSQRHC